MTFDDRDIDLMFSNFQVTVYGQSSGGTAILALLASPLATGLFHGAWLASASPVLNKTATDTYKDNLMFVNNTGCLNVTCLYDLSPEKVVDNIPWKVYPYWAMLDQQTLPEKGLFDGALTIIDGYVLKETPFEAFAHARGNDVPVMIGTMAQETDTYPPDSEHIAAWNQSTYESNVRQKLSTLSDVIAEMALRLYPVGPQTPAPVYEYLYTSMTSDVRVNCGNDYLSLILATSFKSPVYRYVVTHILSNPFAIRANATFLMKFSMHGMDVGGFYKTMADLNASNKQLSDVDMAYQNIMRQEMTSFITSGRPNSTAWGQFPHKTATISDTVSVVPGYHTAECMFWLANGLFSYSWIN